MNYEDDDILVSLNGHHFTGVKDFGIEALPDPGDRFLHDAIAMRTEMRMQLSPGMGKSLASMFGGIDPARTEVTQPTITADEIEQAKKETATWLNEL